MPIGTGAILSTVGVPAGRTLRAPRPSVLSVEMCRNGAMNLDIGPPCSKIWIYARLRPLEVRPTSPIAGRTTVGRTSFDRSRLGTRPKIRQSPLQSLAAFLGGGWAVDARILIKVH